MKFLRILAIIFFVTVCTCGAHSNAHYLKNIYDSLPAGKNVLTTRTIEITGHHRNGKLDLKDEKGNDADTLNVFYGDDIVWVCSDSDITIVNIKEKLGTGNHFKNKPAAQTPKKWQGTVETYADDSVHISKYFIRWKHSTTKYTDDPLIKINPTQNNN